MRIWPPRGNRNRDDSEIPKGPKNQKFKTGTNMRIWPPREKSTKPKNQPSRKINQVEKSTKSKNRPSRKIDQVEKSTKSKNRPNRKIDQVEKLTKSKNRLSVRTTNSSRREEHCNGYILYLFRELARALGQTKTKFLSIFTTSPGIRIEILLTQYCSALS